VVVIFQVRALIRDGGLQVKDAPGGDGGANDSQHRQQVVRFKLNRGGQGFFEDDAPIGFDDEDRDNVTEGGKAKNEQNCLDVLVVPAQNDEPDQEAGQRNGKEAADAKKLAHRGYAGELRQGGADVRQQQACHREGRSAHAKTLADEVCRAFAGHGAHAGRHFLHQHLADCDQDNDPQKAVAVFCAGDGIGGDARRVVIRAGGNQTRADDGEKQEDPAQPERKLELSLHDSPGLFSRKSWQFLFPRGR